MSAKKEITSYPLRLPADLKEVVEKIAKKHRRSFNAEIISRLEQSLRYEGYSLDEDQIKEPSKVYDVQPTVSTKTNFKERYTKKGVDNLALATAIVAGEKYMQEQNAVLSIEKKALLFAIIYDLIDDEEPDASSISNKTIDMLLKLAS